jgi:hypothetical protein
LVRWPRSCCSTRRRRAARDTAGRRPAPAPTAPGVLMPAPP